MAYQINLTRKGVSIFPVLGWIVTITFIAMTFVPRSVDNVMFVDGLAYAAISRNMAFGQGSFWQPYFADSFWLTYNNLCSFFCEHPPLMFGMQSLLFRIFGDSVAVENLYNAIVLFFSVLLISLIWKSLFKDHSQIKQQSWLPILLWYALQIVWWSVPNNLLDTTMAVFCMASCYFQLKAFDNSRIRLVYWILAGAMVVLACLTKGPVGLFPLAFSVLYTIAFGKNNLQNGLLGCAIVTGTVLLIGGLILLYPPARLLLSNYFEGQIMLALLKKREKVSGDWTAHFYIVRLLVKNIIPHIILIISLIITSKFLKIKTTFSPEAKSAALLTLLVLISILGPMMISVKQGDYYLMPALPFVGLFFGACSVEMLLAVMARFGRSSFHVLAALAACFIGAMTYQLINPENDRMCAIANNLKKHIPAHAKLYLPQNQSMLSEMHTPLQRYARLSIAFNPHETKYLYFDYLNQPMLDSIRRTGEYNIIPMIHDTHLAVRAK